MLISFPSKQIYVFHRCSDGKCLKLFLHRYLKMSFQAAFLRRHKKIKRKVSKILYIFLSAGNLFGFETRVLYEKL